MGSGHRSTVCGCWLVLGPIDITIASYHDGGFTYNTSYKLRVCGGVLWVFALTSLGSRSSLTSRGGGEEAVTGALCVDAGWC